MASAEHSGEPLRDFSSPATWGDVEQMRTSLETRIDTGIADVKVQVSDVQAEVAEVRTELARLETRLVGQMAEMETRSEARTGGIASSLSRLDARVDSRLAEMEVRLTRMFLGAAAAGVAVLGVLIGILQAVD